MLRAFAAVARLLRAVIALATLAVLVGGVPWLLATVAGWPLDWIGWRHPTLVPGLSEVVAAVTSPWSDDMLFAVLACLGWVLWLVFLRDVIVEVIEVSAAMADARDGRRHAPVGRGPVRWVAAVLVGAVVGTILGDTLHAGTPASAAAANAAARRPAVAVAPAHAVSAQALPVHAAQTLHERPVVALAAAPRHSDDIPSWAKDAPGRVHRVENLDNLWDIADAELGDPHRWREIYVLNRGHEQANGYALTDPDEIHIGWVLALPAHADTTPPADATPGPDTSRPADLPNASTPDPHADPAPTTPAPANPTPAPSGTTMPEDGVDAPEPAPAATASTGTAAPSTGPASAPAANGPTAPAGSAATTPTPADSTPPSTATADHAGQHSEAGVSLPSQGWISLGLAAVIAAVAALVRLQRRRCARLTFPIEARLAPPAGPVPADLALAAMVGQRHLPADDDPHRPAIPTVSAPIGVNASGGQVSLFDLPGPVLALAGDGADPAARAVLAAALGTGTTATIDMRPMVVTTATTLARLLPEGAPLVGIDPDGTAFDGERLLVVADGGAAVTHVEEELITRRRLLDSFDVDSVAALNARPGHAEHQPPYVLLMDAPTRHTARLLAVAAQRAALDLHPLLLGAIDGIPSADVDADGTTDNNDDVPVVRFSTLAAGDLAGMLSMLTDAAARSEPGHDIDHDPAPIPAIGPAEATDPVPAPPRDTPAPVRVRVLGPVLVDTDAGRIATGLRSGSLVVLASLAVHPGGRTLDQLTDDLHPGTDPASAGKRIRTDISTIRRVLRSATGRAEAKFVVYDEAAHRYRLDSDLITVDLWRMLTTIETANTATDDTAALAALRAAADLYGGDFAEGQDQPWVTDHATSYRHTILAVHARIAELLEADHPDQAIAELEKAAGLDPVNEELYQRIMRIHGRAGRPDAVRRTLRRLEERLAELGDTEPSEATRRVAYRQLRPTSTSQHAVTGAPR